MATNRTSISAMTAAQRPFGGLTSRELAALKRTVRDEVAAVITGLPIPPQTSTGDIIALADAVVGEVTKLRRVFIFYRDHCPVKDKAS